MTDDEKLDKQQAAEYLGISPRTLLRLTGTKIAHLPKLKGREADKTYYSRAALDAHKASMTGAPVHSAVVTHDTPQNGDSQALSPVSSMTGMTGAPNADTLSAMAALISAGVRESLREIAPLFAQDVPPAPAVWLTLSQASDWLGIPKRHISRALHADREEKPYRIKTLGVGRGFRLHAPTLRAYFEG